MSIFEKSILTALSRCPEGYMQRLDGLMCETGVLDKDFWFFNTRMWLLKRKGLVGCKVEYHSIIPSANKLPFYWLTDNGRERLKEYEEKEIADGE